MLETIPLASDFDYQQHLPLWQVSPDAKLLKRVFAFKDFKQAFAFMTQCAQQADQMDHHPDWSNSWNKVTVQLSTHSMDALTSLDLALAKAMDQFAAELTQ